MRSFLTISPTQDVQKEEYTLPEQICGILDFFNIPEMVSISIRVNYHISSVN